MRLRLNDGRDAGPDPSDWRAICEAMQPAFERDGYVTFPGVLDATDVDRLRAALAPLIAADVRGRNDFEGLKTNRIYALLGKDPVFADLVCHPLVLAVAEAELGASCLLSACLAINLRPGESAQPWHHDDAHIEIPLPRPPHGLSAFWTIDPMTEENGATEVIPGSHRWTAEEAAAANDAGLLVSDRHFADHQERPVDDDPGARADAVKVVLPAGSLMLAKGSLIHRGGANRSNAARLIITPQYCPGWARPLETMLLAVPPAKAAALPRRAQELIGYSIHPPFMGYADGVHPRKVLDR